MINEILANIPNEKTLDGLQEFVGEFYSDRNDELSQMREMLKEKNYEELRAMAHKWKGFSVPYGFNGLETLSRQLEKDCESMDYGAASERIEQISDYLNAKGQTLH
ncbi:MAG: hypothetical protein CME62_06755 [Halobacteriovoraceae bacterium]|nr:hypothetical protein [Halobacteriovoraceae bacterium]|tara:strand:- start:6234 stop:6551 length:318 start_codon:yes stop_codon:yes gene_type:complete